MEEYKVFEMNDCDLVVAKTEEDAKSWYEHLISREEIDEQFEGEASLNKIIVIDTRELDESEREHALEVIGSAIETEEELRVTLGTWLEVMVLEGIKEPFIIASTEY